MKIMISGSSGLLGRALDQNWKSDHQIIRLVRAKTLNDPNTIYWKPAQNIIHADDLEGFDVIIHLAGESIAGLWTPSKKNKIYNSRIQSTRLLAKTIAKLKKPPKIFASTSGVNYYGDSGDRILDESVPAGTGFLARVCRDWERATEYLKKTDVRTILMRFGVVLSEKGGFLKTLLPLYKMGFGSKLGKGDQFISWIVLDDLVRAVDFLIKNSDISGAVNVTSPYPIRNRDLNRVLGKTLHRPTFRVPAFMLRIVLGQMADELMLSSIRAVPDKLESGRFEFEYPFFDKAIQRLTEKEST